MSRRGRSTGAAISLFSFQDIITSVTAIMILLVLILTLELISSTRQQGVAAEDRRVASGLRSSVAAMEREVGALRSELVTLQAAATRSASFSAADVRARERKAAERAATLAEEVTLLESQLRTASAARRRSEADLVATRSIRPEDSAEHVVAMEQRAGEIEAANRAEQERQRQAATDPRPSTSAASLVFNTPPGELLVPRLVEVSAAGLATVEPGGGQPRRFRGPGREFDAWLEALDSSGEYVVVILRPSGVSVYDEVVAAVRQAGVGVGAELVGEGTAVTLGEGK
jgi:hypothetical protein